MGPRAEIAIVGGGVTGLAVGCATGAPVFERADGPGGLCRSYHVRAGEGGGKPAARGDDDAYRFEMGGGHWIFGGDPETIDWLSDLAPLRVYTRRAEVRVPEGGTTVPYPLQAHAERLGTDVLRAVARETAGGSTQEHRDEHVTFHQWLLDAFGPTLCRLFFHPFNDRYTAGLTGVIAPQDGYKSPTAVAAGNAAPAGYNASFRYPEGGLDALTERMAERCDVRYGHDVVAIDTAARELRFADGAVHPYEHLVSTMPLHRALSLTGIDVAEPCDPFTSALVLNIGAERGPECPDCHWLYDPGALTGFHRIGFYSNVDADFLPLAHRTTATRVALYVERSFPGGSRPSAADVDAYARAVVAELQARGVISEIDVLDPSWVEVAYTWRRVGSSWRERALEALSARGVEQLGRYGRWHFQGIAESIAEGLTAGRSMVADAGATPATHA